MTVGKLHVKVLRARNLRIADLGGLSDPFVTLRLAGPNAPFAQLNSAPEFGKTSVVEKNLNPEWNEEFSVDLKDIHDCVVLHVWDKDLIGKDDLGWLALSVRHNAELLLSNKPVWLPLSLGHGEEGEIQVHFRITDTPKPFGTLIREGVRENNVPVNTAAHGVALRQQLIRKEARARSRAYNTRRKVWKRTDDGFDIPLPPGSWLKANQFLGRWRLMFRREKETQSTEYINIAAYFASPENPSDSLADLAVQSTHCQVEEAECTVLGYPAAKLKGMSSQVYFIDVGSKPLYWVLYLVDDFATRRNKDQVMTAVTALSLMLGNDNKEAQIKLPKLSEMSKSVFELRTFECKIVCPPLWFQYNEPHHVLLYSPWSKTVIDAPNSQQMDKTDRIRISRTGHKSAEDAVMSCIASAKAAKTAPTWIVENPTEVNIEGAKLKFTYVKWKGMESYHYTAYFGELQPGLVLSVIYESYHNRSEADLPAILASIEYLAPN